MIRTRAHLSCALAATLLALAGCDRAPATGFFPLEAGHRWTYDVKTEHENNSVEHETLTLLTLGSEAIEGGSAWRRRSESGVDYWLRADASGIYRVASKSDLDYVIVNRQKSGCVPSGAEIETYASLDEINAAHGEVPGVPAEHGIAHLGIAQAARARGLVVIGERGDRVVPDSEQRDIADGDFRGHGSCPTCPPSSDKEAEAENNRD